MQLFCGFGTAATTVIATDLQPILPNKPHETFGRRILEFLLSCFGSMLSSAGEMRRVSENSGLEGPRCPCFSAPTKM